MKKILITILIVSTLVYGRKIRVKMATLAPEGTEWHGMLLEMGQKWKKVTNGKVDLIIYPGGVLGDERDMVRKMRIGQIHAAGITTEGLTEIVPDFSAFYVPLAFQNEADIYKVLDDMQPTLEKKLEENGFKLIYLADLGWAYWFSKSKVTSPNDLKNKKIFTWAGDFKWAEIYKKAGYTPVPLASTDILSGLQTGLIEAISTMPLYALAQQSFGVANHMLDLKWGALMAGIIIDNKTWNRIPKIYHNDMIEIAQSIQKKHQATNRNAESQAIEAMKQFGLIIHTPTKEETLEWENEVKKMEPYLRGNVISEDIYDRVLELTGN
ncbi:MAG: TRAP transporter substrate-binding protein DctP [Candidatus Marinimicrobia bacterium]|jgi:TRAP-type C4-dicarboxylate transport system substrate-binding protein|nr:TRAP transporter substrate-binding protein DctP [Candidatus Neomarinimicrobiota bacterium]MBT3502341.1 TRAP transporter substrate-binding protein DctP [Candidatus Neomarinimicrobiota bacterium]MBT3840377.1 TRAP transporter substrate-binding protein DctP [Candidatus Neomarinimicrobiota bacterium]MBT3999442.1 TRAP transporter substrate-binding protein DctP [Candidatus Neomarinimicrobiota bacterium]MBT4956968.1 TRAP transporter substrate-binding protein DctP [Candidatus Neomarinimicrobiota bact